MKTYRTPLHRKPKPWRFRKARRITIRDATRRTETRYRRKKRLEARANRQWFAEEMHGRPKWKSSRERWEADYVRRWDAWRRRTFRPAARDAKKLAISSPGTGEDVA